jgi:tetratricopeptide (TPR) repeat protein
MTKALCVVIAAGALLWCGLASAQQNVEDEARVQFDAGVALYEKGQFAQASIAFARAYELRPAYKILYLVGKCENEQGHFAASADAYTRYLAEAGNQIDQARQDEVRAEIKRLKAMVGVVAIETNATGVTVFVDGRKAGKMPLAGPLFVDLGEHEVQLKRGTTDVYREVVKVAGGQRVVVKAEVEGAAAEPVGEVAAPKEALKEAPKEKPKRIWTWVAFGVGGAAAITSAITGGVFVSKSKDVKAQCDGNDCPTSVKADADSTKTLGNATTALIVVAGVGIAAGVALYFLEPKWSKNESAVEIAPVAAVTPDGGALGLVGRF